MNDGWFIFIGVGIPRISNWVTQRFPAVGVTISVVFFNISIMLKKATKREREGKENSE